MSDTVFAFCIATPIAVLAIVGLIANEIRIKRMERNMNQAYDEYRASYQRYLR